MPTYEYRCQACGHHFEVFQSIKDDPVVDCPECGGRVTRLLSGGAGLIFKGSGFYITDYKNKSTSGGDKAGSKKKSESSADSGGKTDKKKKDKSSE